MTAQTDPSWDNGITSFYQGDCRDILAKLPVESVQCVVTSPPYWGLRDYGADAQLGLEETPDAYVANLVDVFRAVRRVLRKDGTVWLNLGDSYAGNNSRASDGGRAGLGNPKAKDLVGIPWRVAFALQADGWYLRSDIIWSKPNPMPESVTDRPTKSHEYIFLLTKSPHYYYDADSIREPMSEATRQRDEYSFSGAFKGQFKGHPTDQRWQNGKPISAPSFYDSKGRNKRSVWEIESKFPDASYGGGGQGLRGHRGYYKADGTRLDNPLGRNKRDVWEITLQPYPEAHFATFPEALVKPCILAGTKERDTVLDPFAGSGTVMGVAQGLGRSSIGIELSEEYLRLAIKRIQGVTLPMLGL